MAARGGTKGLTPEAERCLRWLDEELNDSVVGLWLFAAVAVAVAAGIASTAERVTFKNLCK